MSRRNIDFKATADYENPTPASPTRPPLINIIITTSDDRREIWNFSAYYAVRKAIEFFIAGRSYHWSTPNRLHVNTDYGTLSITTPYEDDALQKLYSTPYTRAQEAWDLPLFYLSRGNRLCQPPITDWTERMSDILHPETKPAKEAPRTAKEPKPDKAPRPSGLIDLPTLLSDTDIEPKEARQALRKSSITKPAHGRWEFTQQESADVKKQILAIVAKMRKK